MSRLEREAQTLKRVGEDIFRLQERLEKEKSNREASMHSLQSEVNEMAGGRNLSDEKFQVRPNQKQNDLCCLFLCVY